MATAQIVGKFSYWIRGNLYISVTNKLNSLSFHQLRGKSFQELPYLPLQYEPSDVEMAECINQAYEDGKIHVDSMKSEVITFAGYGDPLFKIDEICSAVKIVKENRHGVPFRVKTNGLFHDPEQIANQLYDAGIKQISVPLLTDNPRQYNEIIQPYDPKLGFHTVCNFIVACVDRGLIVTCGAMERPDVNISRVRTLSQSLGAPLFQTYSYHP